MTDSAFKATDSAVHYYNEKFQVLFKDENQRLSIGGSKIEPDDESVE